MKKSLLIFAVAILLLSFNSSGQNISNSDTLWSVPLSQSIISQNGNTTTVSQTLLVTNTISLGDPNVTFTLNTFNLTFTYTANKFLFDSGSSPGSGTLTTQLNTGSFDSIVVDTKITNGYYVNSSEVSLIGSSKVFTFSTNGGAYVIMFHDKLLNNQAANFNLSFYLLGVQGDAISPVKMENLSVKTYTTAVVTKTYNTTGLSNNGNIESDNIFSYNNVVMIKGKIKEGVLFSIFDMSGKQVIGYSVLNNENVIDLPKGIYFLKIIDQKGDLLHSKKLTISKE